MIANGNAAFFLQRDGIPNANLRGAIVHVDILAVVGERPAFSRIVEGPELRENSAGRTRSRCWTAR